MLPRCAPTPTHYQQKETRLRLELTCRGRPLLGAHVMSPAHFCPSLDLAPRSKLIAEREPNRSIMAGVVRAVLTVVVPANAARWMRVVASPLSSTKEACREQSFRRASLRAVVTSSPPTCSLYHVQPAAFQHSSTKSGPERLPEDRTGREPGKTSQGSLVIVVRKYLPDRGYLYRIFDLQQVYTFK